MALLSVLGSIMGKGGKPEAGKAPAGRAPGVRVRIDQEVYEVPEFSLAGFRTAGSHPSLVAGQRVHFRLVLPGGGEHAEIPASGVVTRHRDDSMVIRMAHLVPADQKRLAAAVAGR